MMALGEKKRRLMTALVQGQTKVVDGSCEEVMEIGDGSYE